MNHVQFKYVFTALLPILVVIIYSIIFKINIVQIVRSLTPEIILAFILSYIGQISVIAIRDKKIVGVSFYTAFKARLLGNSIGLILPGWVGQELTRATVYSREKVELIQGFSLSLLEAYYDVTAGSVMFLILLPIRFIALELIYIFITLGNIIGWSLGLAYVYTTAGKTIKIEKSVVKLIGLDKYYFVLNKGKQAMKDKIEGKNFIKYFFLTILGYLVQSLSFIVIVPDYFKDVLINMTFFAATLFPIPGASGVSEIAFSLFLPPHFVVAVVVLELLDYFIGFIFIRDIDINELKKEFYKIKKYGELYQGSES
jgi:hypothetical protein